MPPQELRERKRGGSEKRERKEEIGEKREERKRKKREEQTDIAREQGGTFSEDIVKL